MSMKGKKQKQGGGDVVIEMDTIMSLRQATNTETVINMVSNIVVVSKTFQHHSFYFVIICRIRMRMHHFLCT